MNFTKQSPEYQHNLNKEKQSISNLFYFFLIALAICFVVWINSKSGSFFQGLSFGGMAFFTFWSMLILFNWDSAFHHVKYLPQYDVGDTIKLTSCEFEEVNPPLQVVKMNLKNYLLKDNLGNFSSLKISNQIQYSKVETQNADS